MSYNIKFFQQVSMFSEWDHHSKMLASHYFQISGLPFHGLTSTSNSPLTDFTNSSILFAALSQIEKELKTAFHLNIQSPVKKKEEKTLIALANN